MIKPEMVPHAAMNALLLALRQRRGGKEAIAAALNAWPGMSAKQADEHVALFNSTPALILPLMEKTDDKA